MNSVKVEDKQRCSAFRGYSVSKLHKYTVEYTSDSIILATLKFDITALPYTSLRSEVLCGYSTTFPKKTVFESNLSSMTIANINYMMYNSLYKLCLYKLKIIYVF